ncbi:MAG: hypothetical protein AMXMBFR77_21960 [Phycisphaerales bacterium]|nr:MAG: hypothetical protein BroJett004_22620 [Planctomycetota bacterium]
MRRAIGALLLASAMLKAWHPASLIPAMEYVGMPEALRSLGVGTIVGVEAVVGYGLLVFAGTYSAWASVSLLGGFSFVLLYFAASSRPPACGCLGVVKVFESNRAEALFGIGRNCVLIGALFWTFGSHTRRR